MPAELVSNWCCLQVKALRIWRSTSAAALRRAGLADHTAARATPRYTSRASATTPAEDEQYGRAGSPLLRKRVIHHPRDQRHGTRAEEPEIGQIQELASERQADCRLLRVSDT